MEKDFDGWNTIKKRIERRGVAFSCCVREIWWCSVGLNIGSEQDGRNKFFERPILILKKFNNHTILAVSITSTIKEDKYNFIIDYEGQSSSILLTQIRLLSVKRLRRFVRKISTYDFNIIKGRVIDHIDYL
jgi:mRNA-degrading endonuclease toxin of MazEF toxin-antitoxin module